MIRMLAAGLVSSLLFWGNVSSEPTIPNFREMTLQQQLDFCDRGISEELACDAYFGMFTAAFEARRNQMDMAEVFGLAGSLCAEDKTYCEVANIGISGGFFLCQLSDCKRQVFLIPVERAGFIYRDIRPYLQRLSASEDTDWRKTVAALSMAYPIK